MNSVSSTGPYFRVFPVSVAQPPRRGCRSVWPDFELFRAITSSEPPKASGVHISRILMSSHRFSRFLIDSHEFSRVLSISHQFSLFLALSRYETDPRRCCSAVPAGTELFRVIPSSKKERGTSRPAASPCRPLRPWREVSLSESAMTLSPRTSPLNPPARLLYTRARPLTPPAPTFNRPRQNVSSSRPAFICYRRNGTKRDQTGPNGSQ